MKRIKASDLDLFDESDLNLEEKMTQRYRQIVGDDLDAPFDWWFEKVVDRIADLMRTPALLGKNLSETKKFQIINREVASFDFLPLGPASGRLFVLENGNCKVWSVLGDFTRGGDPTKRLMWRLTYSKEPVAIIDLGFSEPFTVFANKDAYFFLTRSCKLYSATKSADDKWKVEKLWSEPNRPIHSVITDTATNRSYAFTQAKADKDGKKAKDVYFAFDTKLEPVEFDRAKLKSFKLVPPLDPLRSYTQVLIDDKKIDPTPPKKKD